MSSLKVEKIEDDIAETRHQIDLTLGEIERRVSPDALESLAHSKILEARTYLEQQADQTLSRLSGPIDSMGGQVSNLLKQHPIKVVLAGLALAYFLSPKSHKPHNPNLR